ncbi:MAG: histidine kinase N-terminal 7TM domain-containing protein [Porcipelethomonas sp.]
MKKHNKNNIFTAIIIASLLIIAYICRIPGLARHSTEAGLVRTLIYMTLYVVWCFSLRSRIIQVQARRYITAIASLMVFWFLVRTMKYHFISPELHPGIIRYLWYFYYLPMLFIPLLSVFAAMSIRRPEDYRLPGRTAFLFIPPSALFMMVVTNDLHQLVFTFPGGTVRTDDNYSYGIGYYLIVGFLIVCVLSTFIIMFVKCRIPGSRKRILLPCIPVCVLLLYFVLYYLHTYWLMFIAGDMTAVFCLMYAAALEICIRCGFIQANTHYRELFDASTVGAQITDNEYRVVLSSRTAEHFSTQLLRRTEKNPVMLETGLRISGTPIHGGHVIWSEDMSSLLRVLDELREAKENLEDSNGIMEEENAVRARETHIAEQERLYNIIQRDTSRQISLMDELIGQAESAGTDGERVKLLKKMLVTGAYLKRRSNLVFLSDKNSMLEAQELALALRESLDNLEMYGVTCGFRSELTEPVPAVHIMSMYDLFEEVTERSLDRMSSITVYAAKTEDGLTLIINTDSTADFSDLASDTVRAVPDEDNEWQLTFCSGMGGAD